MQRKGVQDPEWLETSMYNIGMSDQLEYDPIEVVQFGAVAALARLIPIVDPRILELVMFAFRRLLVEASNLGSAGEVALYEGASANIAAMPKYGAILARTPQGRFFGPVSCMRRAGPPCICMLHWSS